MPEPTAKILLLDPDEALTLRLSRFLNEAGYMSQAYNCPNAIQSVIGGLQSGSAVPEERPDLVIMELDLVGLNAIDVIERIKKTHPHIAIILFSGNGGVKDLVYALRAGVDDYLLKPLKDFNVVEDVVEKALKRSLLEQEHAQAQKDLRRLNAALSERMHALQQDQAAGRIVQEQFMPPSPVSLGGIDVSFEITPSFYLSGDSVDYGLIAGRYLAFYLTDVSGHGSASAFVTVWVKQLVRSFFRDEQIFRTRDSFESDIPLMMKLINEELLKASIGPHLTCFVGVIDTHELELNYAVGGHLPLPLLKQHGDVQVLSGSGKPLGLFDGVEWQVNHLKLDKSFELVVFSDGVLELFEGKSLDDKELSLASIVRSGELRDLSNLRNRLPLQNRDAVPDDVAMLLLKR